MSNYKNLMPIALIAFVLLGCYIRFRDSNQEQNQYNQYLEDARTFREEKIYVDALACYEDALEMKNTFEICQEVGDMMLEADKANQIESWGEYMIEAYPKRVEGYEYLVDYYLGQGNYSECFTYYDIAEKRNLHSDSLTEKVNSILYEYNLSLNSYEEVQEYSNGYAVVSKEGKYGYVNESGKYMIKPQYIYAGAFCRDYGPIQDEFGEFYFVDIDGNRRMNYPADIKLSVTRLGYVGNGEYAVGNDTEVYFANTDGAVVSGPYEDAGAYSDGRTAVLKDGKWYMADLQGNIVSDGYLQFAMDVKRDIFRNGAAFAQNENGYVMLNGEGALIAKNQFADAKCFLDETYAAVKLGDTWGFVDKNGEIVIEPAYEDALSFANGFAAVKQDGHWGYINLEGEMAISPIFDSALSMNGKGGCFVKQSGAEEWSFLELIRYK